LAIFSLVQNLQRRLSALPAQIRRGCKSFAAHQVQGCNLVKNFTCVCRGMAL